ncbi:RNA-binding ribosome biosynthesis protein mak21 [Massospora cicadina]|nr:RNA-binding ribosome biosynthesis protein mak21 [Massospora cicadina]
MNGKANRNVSHRSVVQGKGITRPLNFGHKIDTTQAKPKVHVRFSEDGKQVEEFKPQAALPTTTSNPTKFQKGSDNGSSAVEAPNFKGANLSKPINLSTRNVGRVTSKPSDATSSATLLREISALGGTKLDYELLKDVDSEDDLMPVGEEAYGNLSDEEVNFDLDLGLSESGSRQVSGVEPISRSSSRPLASAKIKLEDLDEDPEVSASGSEAEETLTASRPPKEGDFEFVREGLEPEIDFDAKDSVVTSQQTTRAFSNSSQLKPNTALFQPLQKPLFESTPIWYELPLPEVDEGPGFSMEYARLLYEQAKLLLDQENELVAKRAKRSSDKGLLEEILRSGTLNDKISALTLKVRGAPIHNMAEFRKLLSMMARNNRRESLPCLNSFKDLCVGNLLPSDRKLKFFEDQPLSSPNVRQSHLVLWYFEDYLKKAFYNFLLLSEARSHDPVGLAKHNMLGHFFDLLSTKPEQEANLLTLVVNKLGDKENKVASKASYILLQLIELHPQMKGIVAAEVRTLIERPNISLRAQYYASVTLNQFVLTAREVSVANLLVEIYFDLFKKLMSTKATSPTKKDTKKLRHKKKNKPTNAPAPVDNEEVISSAVAAVLTGVNRAFPFSKVEPTVLERHIETLFRICQTFSFNAAIQSLNLLFQISSTHTKIRPRFTKALYSTLLDPRVIHSSKQALHLNLLFRALKAEVSFSVVMAFVKRMGQIAAWHQPPYVNGLLFLIFKLAQFHPIINNSIAQPEDGTDAGEAREGVINSAAYSGRDDNPAGTKAEYACLWELGLLVRHFHPTVAHYARQVLSQESITEQPQLHYHTLMHFLDRFVFRNAKRSQGGERRGPSVMQPIPGVGTSSGLVWAKGAPEVNAITSEDFVSKKPSEIAADKLFFYKYFSLAKDGKAKARPAVHDGSDEEDEFFTSLLGGLEAGEDDEDVDLEDGDMASDNEEREDIEGLKHAEDAPGFEDFSEFEGQSEDVEDSEGDVDFDFDDGSFGEPKGEGGSLKRTLHSESSDEETEPEVGENAKRNRATRERKKRLKALPTFASMDEYAHLLSD